MRSLTRLLKPRSIAVIGGGSWCEAVLKNCRQAQHAAASLEVWPVHPGRRTVANWHSFASVDDLPAAPDAVYVGVNRHATLEVVAKLCRRGAGGAICFASGFAETGDSTGRDLQQALLDAAGDMPILGPNCYGFVNALDGVALWPDQHGLEPVSRGVAIIAQSSNLALNISMQQRGLPIGGLYTIGNQLKLGFADLGAALLADERVTALGLHVEGFGDLRALERLAGEARRLGKPVVVFKVGRSQAAQLATVSHTASLCGTETGAAALLERLGLRQATRLEQWLDTLQLLHVHPSLPGRRLVSLSCSGGEAALVADALVAAGEPSGAGALPEFAPFSAPVRDRLAGILGPLATLANPLDYHTAIWRNRDALSALFDTVATPDVALTLLVLDLPRADRCRLDDWLLVIDALIEAQAGNGQAYAVVSSLQENLPEHVARRLRDAGIAALGGIDQAMAAVWLALCPPPVIDTEPVWLADLPEARQSVPTADAFAVLGKSGIALAPAASVLGVEAAADAACDIGFPVALKGEGIAHKTEAGAVALGLSDRAAVMSAATQMPVSRFRVERMIEEGLCELLVSAVHDPAHGYLLTLAAGGTLTELIADRVALSMPASAAAIEAALKRLRIAPLLSGFRRRPACNLPAVIDAIQALQTVVRDTASVVELEINPLICTADGAIAADVLMICSAKSCDAAGERSLPTA